MDKLLDAYDFIEHYRKRNRPVPDDVAQEARDAEIDYLQRELAVVFQEHIQPILDNIQSELTLVCEHKSNKPAQIFISREKDIVTLLDDAISLSKSFDNIKDSAETETQDIDDEVFVEDEVIDTQAGRSKSIGFTVRFDDGYVVSRSNAKDTMIDTFRHIGFDRVATFKGRTFRGYSLVDRRKRNDGSGTWQEQVEDGWYVYINMGNDTKKIMIQRVANALNIKLNIFDNIESGVDMNATKARKPRAVYSLNGRAPLDKRNSVLAVVKAYAATRPNATYNEIRRSFPDQLQGSYGVVKSLDEIEERRSRGQQVDNRYFLDPRDILTSADGVEYAVSNQWGEQFHQFQEHVKNFGWTLVEI